MPHEFEVFATVAPHEVSSIVGYVLLISPLLSLDIEPRAFNSILYHCPDNGQLLSSVFISLGPDTAKESLKQLLAR